MNKTERRRWRKIPCLLEVDLEYPKELHDLHNEYPLAPERLEIDGVEKLVSTLRLKQNYVVHHETLKQYLSLGLKLVKIHRGIRFEESPWLQSYITLNTELRKKAKNEFEKEFFKLTNNSVSVKPWKMIEREEIFSLSLQ